MVQKKALVLFSGGQDSTTCLGWALNRYEEVECISFFYGQKHKKELEQAKKITDILKLNHEIVLMDFLPSLVDSALTSNGDVNKPHSRLKNLPASYVPNRNIIMLTLAHCYAQKIGAECIVTGTCETDYSGYPDCRASVIKLLEEVLTSASQTFIRFEYPLMQLNKAQTFELADKEGFLSFVIDHSLTCYNGDIEHKNEWGYGCGTCPACRLRANGFERYKSEIISRR